MGSTPLWIRAVLLLLLVQAVRARIPSAPPAEALRARAELRIELDPRAMCVRELRQLPGLGPALALAVAEARDGHRAPWPLLWEHVPGIGEVRARRIRAWLRARGMAPDPLAWGTPARGTGYPLGVTRLPLPVWLVLAPFLGACREARPAAAESAAAPEASAVSTAASTEVRTRAMLGGALHAREAGPERGACVLLLHGGRYSARDWEELGTLARLAGAGLHAVAIDWPGYGASTAWKDAPSAPELLGRVLAELAVERALVVGASLGGGFALELAAAAPERVAGLVLVAPAGAADFAPARWSTPTLLLWGDEDPILAPAVGRGLRERLTGARLEILPGGHACYLEQPERFHELLLAFAVPQGAR
jgi:alpha/beta hydrolase family protein